MKRRYVLTILAILSILLVGIIIFNYNGINETIQKVWSNQEKLEDKLSMKVQINELSGKNALISIIFENPLGISEIMYPNENTLLNCNQREKIAIDYSINKQDTYTFNITSARRNKRTKRNKL